METLESGIFRIVLFESADKFGQLHCNYEIEIIGDDQIGGMCPDKKTYSHNIAIFTQFRLQSLHQYIDCVVAIASVGSGALRWSAFLNM